jgi:AraC-like DNA-binding protein
MLTGWYSPVEPPAALASLLVCAWTAIPSGTHTLVPDGCIDVLWLSDGALLVCGPETTAWSFALPSDTTAVGVRFRPGACCAAFGLDASTIVNRRVPLADYVGDDVATTLSRTMAATRTRDDLQQSLHTYESELVRLWGHVKQDALAETIVDHLVRFPRATQTDLATLAQLTPRQLHRRSLALFGYGTQMLARLMRFQRCLSLAATLIGRPSVSRLAAEAGYSDHAHLVRDCRAITGETPSAFLDSYFPTFPDMSDPYKTQVEFAVSMAQ